MTVLAALTLVAAALASLIFWRRRAVLGVLCTLSAMACGSLALATGRAELLLGALAAVVVGSGVVAVGAGVWSLLDDPGRDDV